MCSIIFCINVITASAISYILSFFLKYTKYIFSRITGYDQIPVDSMQGLEIGGGSTYGAMDTMDVAHEGDLNFNHLGELPAPPGGNNQVAAWYDTDL